MNKIYLLVLTIILLASTNILVAAQDEDNAYVPSVELTTPYVFAEYNANDVSAEAEKEKIETYVLQISNVSKFAYGHIYVYRGATDYNFKYQERVDSIDKILRSNVANTSIEPYQVGTRFAGFRENSTVEMVIEPSYKERRLPQSSISLLDVKYLDDTLISKGTIQKTGQELFDKLIKRVAPSYPTAAKAVRAIGEVGVLTMIDEKGFVTEAKAFLGHPLIRQACEQAVRQWQFKPEKQKGVAVKVVGIAVCDFKPAVEE